MRKFSNEIHQRDFQYIMFFFRLFCKIESKFSFNIIVIEDRACFVDLVALYKNMFLWFLLLKKANMFGHMETTTTKPSRFDR